MFLMEGVEDIPQASLRLGMAWDWESFPEYLDALGARSLGVNVGAHLTHAPLRVWAMGERGATEEPPTDTELARMQGAVRDAVAAGALGFSTGRTTMHRTPAGDPVPGTFAEARELAALVAPLGEAGAGVIQVIPYGGAGEAVEGFARDLAIVAPLARATGRPVSIALAAPRRYPDAWRAALDGIVAATTGGARFVPQVAPRSIGLLLAFGGLSPLFLFPAAGDLLAASPDELRAALRNPEVRARLIASFDPAGELLAGMASTAETFLLERAGVAGYETGRERSVAALAERRGVSPAEVVLDFLVATDLRGLILLALYNADLAAAGTMLTHPLTVPGLGDAGAHTSQTCDVGVGTFILAYWVRRRRALSLEAAVRKLSFEQALAWGIPGRGLVRPGWHADLNVVDLDTLDLELPELRHDLPGGAPNLSQRARGYRATIVNGRVLMRDGVHTGALPGRVLRNEVAAARG
jgi:N-acyl-D-aspartate/D-glutamate deacylase